MSGSEFEPRERLEEDARIRFRACRQRLAEAKRAYQENPTEQNKERAEQAAIDFARASVFM